MSLPDIPSCWAINRILIKNAIKKPRLRVGHGLRHSFIQFITQKIVDVGVSCFFPMLNVANEAQYITRVSQFFVENLIFAF